MQMTYSIVKIPARLNARFAVWGSSICSESIAIITRQRKFIVSHTCFERWNKITRTLYSNHFISPSNISNPFFDGHFSVVVRLQRLSGNEKVVGGEEIRLRLWLRLRLRLRFAGGYCLGPIPKAIKAWASEGRSKNTKSETKSESWPAHCEVGEIKGWVWSGGPHFILLTPDKSQPLRFLNRLGCVWD